MVYLLFQEAIWDTFHQKYFQNQRKNYFTLVKKYFSYSASESLSVSQFVFFKLNGDSNLFQVQIGKNIFEIG